MKQADRRHDRLAVRLSLIISRLVVGDQWSVWCCRSVAGGCEKR